MSPKKIQLGKAYKTTFDAIKANRSLFTPFLIFALIECLVLILLFLSPRMPLRLLFGPPIRTLWGEEFLHYPANFLLLTKLSSLSRMILSVIAGSLTTAAAVAMLAANYQKKRLNVSQSFARGSKKYISAFMVVFLITVIFYVLVKVTSTGLEKYFMSGHRKLLFIGPRWWMGPILVTVNFIYAILIQSLFTYAIPALVIGEEKLTKALITSFKLFGKYFIPTIVLVALPMLCFVPFIVLNYNTEFLMATFFPEIILMLLIINALVSSLVVDFLVTLSTAALFIMDREK